MRKLPYGTSNFAKVARENYYFVDRTAYIAQLEELGEPYLFFLRPRRFGKTVFISMLQCYYGLEFAAQFSDLFGRFAIGQQPTPLANSYLVLRLDFSRINTQTQESTQAGFLENVKQGISKFLTAYRDYFTEADGVYIFAGPNPSIVISRLFERTKNHQVTGKLPHKIYLLIDEYDHFANELVAFRLHDFKQSVGRNGFVRKFYESIKEATGEGTVDRIFITGVSPVTLDSLTSGFNIGTCRPNEQSERGCADPNEGLFATRKTARPHRPARLDCGLCWPQGPGGAGRGNKFAIAPYTRCRLTTTGSSVTPKPGPVGGVM